MASNPSSDPRGLQIAIVGMAGRFPGAADVETFWKNIAAGVESVCFFSDEELRSAGVKAALRKDAEFVSAACRLEGVDLFDARFFGFTPREAEAIDPQQRLFLECAWEALEAAGYDPEAYKGAVGVYAGSSFNGYAQNFSPDGASDPAGEFQSTISNDKDHLSTRVSYKLNLTGPSVTVQTACSTSLVAVHMACQALVSGECDMALAGGVALLVPRPFGYVHQDGSMQSPDGHCRAFDAKARGTIFGEGMGIVVLKRLDDARADGDTIYAVIQGSAINNDGAQKVGYTAPSAAGQAKVIRVAQAVAEIEPETIGYVEAHGTGTELGDPIEIAALTQAFRAGTEKKGFCAIGSVKTNIGHANTAAGVAGLIKTALALKHKTLPPSLHFETPNPKIDFANSPFFVNTEAKPWNADGRPRRAAVSSFGVGGTNAHAVLEEAPEEAPAANSRPRQLLLLSARSETALDAMTANLARHLREHSDIDFADAAYTLQVGRRVFPKRRMLVCRDADDAAQALETKDARRLFSANEERRDRRIAFMFTGQGAQYRGMARELYGAEPTFRKHVDECRALVKPHLPVDLADVLFSQTPSTDLSLDDTRFTQPALFVVEYALSKLWMEWGIEPQAMIGHSIGEYVAACLAGVFSLEDALALVCARGRLMQALPAGAMLSVGLSEEKIRPLLSADVSLAAVNAPDLCVLAGPFDAIAALEKRLDASGTAFKKLRTSHAFHSSMMEPMLEPFRGEVKKIALRPPRLPYISNVTGTWITPNEATDPDYWMRHIRQAVRFGDGALELMKDRDLVLLEVGPGDTLTTLARRSAGAAEPAALASIRRESKQSDVEFILNTLGRLWLMGAPVKWSGFYAYERRRRVALPTYPFERARYWVEAAPKVNEKEQLSAPMRNNSAEQFYIPSWKRAELAHQTDAGRNGSARAVLVFADSCGVAKAVAGRLIASGERVVTVEAGTRFRESDASSFTIRPDEGTDYDELHRRLSANGLVPDTILHFWNVGDSIDPKVHSAGFQVLLPLVQSLGLREVASAVSIYAVSTGMCDVTGEEALSPERATLLGLSRAIPQEYPHIACKAIDIETPESSDKVERAAVQLLKEIASASADALVAYRGSRRWVQILEPAFAALPARLREGGVYLITGGLGNIGLVCANYLAKHARAKLILISRSEFPAKAEWNRWLEAHGVADAVGRKIEKLKAIEALGGEVIVARADVADLKQMAAVIQLVKSRCGAIHGVIHGAGIIGDSFTEIQKIQSSDIDLHFRPKVEGLSVLENLLREEKLDFWLLHSSISTALGGLGMAAYAAANVYMDTLAELRNRQNGTLWISVNWDYWKFEDESDFSKAMKTSLNPERGDAMLVRALGTDAPGRLIVSGGDIESRLMRWSPPQSTDDVFRKPKTTDVSNGKTQSAKVLGEQDLERIVADIWKDILGVAEVGADDNFFELGGNSLSAIQVISRMRTALNANVPMTALIAHPTLGEVVSVARECLSESAGAHELDRVLSDLEQLSDEEAERLLLEEEQKS